MESAEKSTPTSKRVLPTVPTKTSYKLTPCCRLKKDMSVE